MLIWTGDPTIPLAAIRQSPLGEGETIAPEADQGGQTVNVEKMLDELNRLPLEHWEH